VSRHPESRPCCGASTHARTHTHTHTHTHPSSRPAPNAPMHAQTRMLLTLVMWGFVANALEQQSPIDIITKDVKSEYSLSPVMFAGACLGPVKFHHTLLHVNVDPAAMTVHVGACNGNVVGVHFHWGTDGMVRRIHPL
jgi:hypothetical protein